MTISSLWAFVLVYDAGSLGPTHRTWFYLTLLKAVCPYIYILRCKVLRLQHMNFKGIWFFPQQLFLVLTTLVTPWTVACQAPLSMGFSRQEYWSGLPFLFPRNLPNPGIEPRSPALQEDSLPTELQGKHVCIYIYIYIHTHIYIMYVYIYMYMYIYITHTHIRIY